MVGGGGGGLNKQNKHMAGSNASTPLSGEHNIYFTCTKFIYKNGGKCKSVF